MFIQFLNTYKLKKKTLYAVDDLFNTCYSAFDGDVVWEIGKDLPLSYKVSGSNNCGTFNSIPPKVNRLFILTRSVNRVTTSVGG